MGDANFWRMADTGPVRAVLGDLLGPRSRRFGAGGRPARGSEDRYVEIWNLVFMQFDAQPDGTLTPLWKPCVDTGAGLERNAHGLQGVDSIFDIDVFRPLIAEAAESPAPGTRYGGGGERTSRSAILAEHARGR